MWKITATHTAWGYGIWVKRHRIPSVHALFGRSVNRQVFVFCSPQWSTCAITNYAFILKSFLFSVKSNSIHSFTFSSSLLFVHVLLSDETEFQQLRATSSSSTMWVQFLLIASFMGPSKEKSTPCSNCQVRSSIIWPRCHLAQRLSSAQVQHLESASPLHYLAFRSAEQQYLYWWIPYYITTAHVPQLLGLFLLVICSTFGISCLYLFITQHWSCFIEMHWKTKTGLWLVSFR